MIWLVLILATVLRLINLNQSLWLDEATQAIVSSQSIKTIILERSGDFQPPLSYILYHFWIIFGRFEIWLRLLPAIFGVGTVYLIFLLTKQFASQKIALIASFLMTISAFHIYYSQEVRMYSMAAFFTTFSMYAFYLSLRKKSLSSSLAYVVSSVLLIYTHYLGFLILFSQLIYVAVFQKESIKDLFKKQLGVIILWLPWLPLFLNQLKNGVSANQYLPGWSNVLTVQVYKALPLTYLKFIIGRISFDNKYLYGMVAVVVFLSLLLVLINVLKNLKKEIYFLLCWLIIPQLVALLISFKVPLYQPFRLIVTLPPFLILIANMTEGKLKLKYLLIGIFVLFSLTGNILYYTQPKFWREDWRGAAGFLNQTSGEAVFAWPEPFAPFDWYTTKDNGVGVIKKMPATYPEVSVQLSRLNYSDIYYFEYLQDLSDPGKNIQLWLKNNGYSLEKTYNFEGVGFIHHYLKSVNI